MPDSKPLPVPPAIEIPKAYIGDILCFIAFLMVAVGWILGGRKVK